MFYKENYAFRTESMWRVRSSILLEKNKIVQAEPIKTFGSFSVKAKLGYEVSGTINVLVVEG